MNHPAPKVLGLVLLGKSICGGGYLMTTNTSDKPEALEIEVEFN